MRLCMFHVVARQRTARTQAVTRRKTRRARRFMGDAFPYAARHSTSPGGAALLSVERAAPLETAAMLMVSVGLVLVRVSVPVAWAISVAA